MKTLKNIIQEGILNDVDTQINNMPNNAWLAVNPLPNTKDFYIYNAYSGNIAVDWKCPDFIQYYITEFNPKVYRQMPIKDITGIRIVIYANKEVRVFLIANSFGATHNIILPYIGTSVSGFSVKSKKECISFLERLATSKTAMQNLINCVNKWFAKYRYDFKEDERQTGAVSLTSILFN